MRRIGRRFLFPTHATFAHGDCNRLRALLYNRPLLAAAVQLTHLELGHDFCDLAFALHVLSVFHTSSLADEL